MNQPRGDALQIVGEATIGALDDVGARGRLQERRGDPVGAGLGRRDMAGDAAIVFGLAQRYGPRFLESAQLALVNGELGVVTTGFEADGDGPAMQPHIQALTVRDGRVCAIWDVANPDKFTGSPLAP